MRRASSEALSLTVEQLRHAKRLYERINDGDIESPSDFVEPWKTPDSNFDERQEEPRPPRQQCFIPPDQIMGTVDDTDRLETNRINKILATMVNEEYEVQPNFPPLLQRRGDCFYVDGDGHHRSMVAKAIGLEKMYVKCEMVPPALLR